MGDVGGLQMADPSDNPATGLEYGAEKAAKLRVARKAIKRLAVSAYRHEYRFSAVN